MDTHVPVEIDRHGLSHYTLTGAEVDDFYQARTYIESYPGRRKSHDVWIHKRILAILLFPERITVHMACKTCGCVHQVEAFPENLAALGKLGSLCPRCYKESEDARGTLD